jgi:hypothetical protein
MENHVEEVLGNRHQVVSYRDLVVMAPPYSMKQYRTVAIDSARICEETKTLSCFRQPDHIVGLMKQGRDAIAASKK